MIPRVTHFELGFSVRLNCHDGKDGDGTERCRSQQNSIVEQCFRKRSKESDSQQLQCGRKMVCGEYHELPWKQKRKIGVTACEYHKT